MKKMGTVSSKMSCELGILKAALGFTIKDKTLNKRDAMIIRDQFVKVKEIYAEVWNEKNDEETLKSLNGYIDAGE